MKHWVKFILLLLATSAFAHAPERLFVTALRNSELASLHSHQYTYEPGGQRATQTRTGGSSVSYTYDGLGQLSRAWGSGGQSSELLGYSYDGAWNFSQRTNGLSVMTFNVDGQNQLTTAPDGACEYDLNWNLISTQNGRQTYGYDDENRLIRVTQYASANVPSTQTALAYDGLSRLRSRREYTWMAPKPGNRSVTRSRTTAARAVGESGTWRLSSETRYVYDGRRVIQERNGNNVPLVSYTRGTDLSGSLEGAGGIGGLLGRSHGYHSGTGNWSTHNYYHADGAGNITYLVNSSQTLAGSYRYDPYGNLLASSGALAAPNVYRFSSKEIHLNTGLYAYGYRYYSPNWQKWVNQDPIGEWGGLNLYRFVGNNPINEVDPIGLSSWQDMRTLPNYTGPSGFGISSGPTMQDVEAVGTVASIFLEPLDWVMTAKEIYDDPKNPWSYAGIVPFVPSAAGKTGKAICKITKPARTPTRFIDGVKVTDKATGKILEGTVDLKPTLDRISSGKPFPHRNDGGVFRNRPLPGKTTPELPVQPPRYYTEYVHPTTGVNGPGPQRIVVGKGGEMYYTPDHYDTFIPINPL